MKRRYVLVGIAILIALLALPAPEPTEPEAESRASPAVPDLTPLLADPGRHGDLSIRLPVGHTRLEAALRPGTGVAG